MRLTWGMLAVQVARWSWRVRVSLLCFQMCDRVDCTYEASILQAGRDLFGDML